MVLDLQPVESTSDGLDLQPVNEELDLQPVTESQPVKVAPVERDEFLDDGGTLSQDVIDKMTSSELNDYANKHAIKTQARLNEALKVSPDDLSPRAERARKFVEKTMSEDWGQSAAEAGAEKIKENIPFHGAVDAAKAGYESGQELLGKNVAGKAVGAALGGMNVLATAPVVKQTIDLASAAPKIVQAASQDLGGGAAQVTDPDEGVRPWVTPEKTLSMQVANKMKWAFGEDATESELAQSMAEVENFIRNDPVNAALVLHGVSTLGVKGYAIRKGRLGEPLNQTVEKLFPEARDQHDIAATDAMNKILKDRRTKAGAGGPEQGPKLPVEEAVTKTEEAIPKVEEPLKQAELDLAPVETPTNVPVEAPDVKTQVENLKQAASRVGITVKEGGEGSHSGVFPDGTVEIQIGKRELFADADPAKTTPERLQWVRNVIGEELKHGVLQKKWVEDWKQAVKDGTFVGGADRYVNSKAMDIMSDVRKTVAEWNDLGETGLANRIKQTIFDSWNFYNSDKSRGYMAPENAAVRLEAERMGATKSDPGTAEVANIKTPDDLLAHLEKNPQKVPTVMMELVRQMQEMKERGSISERDYQIFAKTPFVEKVMRYIRDAMNSLRVASREIGEGKYGDLIRDALKDTEIMLKKADGEGIYKLSEEEKAQISEDGVRFRSEPPKPGSNEDIFGTGDAEPQGKKPTRWEPTPFSHLERENPISEKAADTLARQMEDYADNATAVEPTWKRLMKGVGVVRESLVDTLEKAGGRLAIVASRIREFLDNRKSLIGRTGGWIDDVLRKIPKKFLNEAYSEFEEYMSIREGRYVDFEDPTKVGSKRRAALADIRRKGKEDSAAFYEKMSPHGKSIVDLVKKLFVETGRANEKVGFMNKDPETGEWRPIGNYGESYWPKIMKDSVRQVLENPKSNPKEYRRMLLAIMKRNGLYSLEQAKNWLVENGILDTKNSNIMGNLKFARTNFLPDSFYEYDFRKVVPTFIARWADEISKVQAFGQDLDGFPDRNIFNTIKTSDFTTQRILKNAKDAIYGYEKTLPRTLMRKGRVLATVTQLTGVLNAMKNLTTIVNTYAQFGVKTGNSAAVKTLRHYAENVREARRSGVLLHDMIASQADVWDMSHMEQVLTEKALKYTGFTPVEYFTRTHASVAGLQWARYALEQIRKNPDSKESLRSIAKAKKLGINLDILKAEGFDGEMAMKLRRAASDNTQFTYDLRHLPGWSTTPQAKFLLQYWNFGIQAANYLENDVLKPAFKGEVVENSKGQEVRVHDFKPLFITAAMTLGVSEGMQAIFNVAMGRDRKDASVSEIQGAVEDDRADLAMKYLALRLMHDAMFLGTFGTLGDKAHDIEDYVNTGKSRAIVAPPGLDLIHNFWDNIITAYMQQGKLTLDDLRTFAERGLPLAKNTHNLVDTVLGDQKHDALRDLARIRALGYRFQNEEKLSEKAHQPEFGKTVNTADYREMQHALMTGDIDEAERIRDRLLHAAPDEKKDAVMRGLMASIAARQPFKVGNIDSISEKDAFKAWMLRRIGEEEFQKLIKLDETYQVTAAKIGLMKNPRIGSVESAENYNASRAAGDASTQIQSENPTEESNVNDAILNGQ